MRYFLKKMALKLIIAAPKVRPIYRICKFYCETVDSENFGDMTMNGELHALRSLASDCQTFFDVGAYTGAWSQAVLKLYPQATLHCFEPLEKAYVQLVNAGFPKQVTINHCGLSSSPGSRLFYPNHLSLYPHPNSSPKSATSITTSDQMVPLNTVDNYCTEHTIANIDYMKIDVEGHELDVLKGASQMLGSRRIRCIQFEYSHYYISAGVFLKDVFAYLHRFGFELFKITPRALVPLPDYRIDLENFCYKNFLARQPGH